MHLNSIQVPSQPHPGLEICVFSPPRLPDSRVFFVSVESYLNLGPDIYISPTSRLHLTSIQVHQIAFQFHPSIISNQYKFQDVCLTSIHVLPQLDAGPKILSELLQCTVSHPSRSIDSFLTAVQVVSHLHVGADIWDSLILAGWNRKFVTFFKGLNCSSIT